MKAYVFGVGVLLMLSFSLAGLTCTAAGVLQRFDLRFRPLLSLSIAAGALVALIVALAWSVPQRG
ncbi:hypothetical protein WL02_02220 [Burkholderia ubonensis]|uniref:hypothetical protein n=1 Tax=Burkholderia ubonensis TaxID=101571 RepID=UPI00075BCFF9|nr:hypothetical protein [Burkholderia ubonensis]KVC82445.1 hypothetical protein WI76_08995 [Burkholderia ubonensis]KVU21747.1 hypothetical protein WK64_31730 [Burkholderia ubonensis]KVX12208.1 hypothetical protein WL02_02220 [Burkholderia ubonensis]